MAITKLNSLAIPPDTVVESDISFPLDSASFTGDLTVDTDTLVVDSTNNRIGVGESSPSYLLDLKGGTNDSIRLNALSGGFIFANGSGQDKGSFSMSGGNMNIAADAGIDLYSGGSPLSGDPQVTLDASGNVGIGKDPSVKLDVDVGSSSSMSRFETSNTALARQYMYGGAASTQVDISFLQNNVLSGVFGVNPNTGDTFIDSRHGSGGNTIFYRTGGERLRVQANGGISFNGDTAAANALDDYEEGTWTPEYVATSGAFGTVTYNEQSGRYVKIGRLVMVTFDIRTSEFNVGTATGSVQLTGLPFQCNGTESTGTVGAQSQWVTNAPEYFMPQSNSTVAWLRFTSGASYGAIQASNMKTGVGVYNRLLGGAGVYYTNS